MRKKVIDDLERSQLESIQVRLVENRKTALEKLKSALRARVERQMDESDERVAMSVAFLQLLRTSSSAAAEGDQIETGRPRTLRQAFAEAFEFFDGVAGYDSSLRDCVSRLQQRLDEQRRNVRLMETERRVAQRRMDEAETAPQPTSKLWSRRSKLVRKTLKRLASSSRRPEGPSSARTGSSSEGGRRWATAWRLRWRKRWWPLRPRSMHAPPRPTNGRSALEVAMKALQEARSGVVMGFDPRRGTPHRRLVSLLVRAAALRCRFASRSAYLWVIHTSAGATIFRIWALISLPLTAFLLLGHALNVRSLRQTVEAARPATLGEQDGASREPAELLGGVLQTLHVSL